MSVAVLGHCLETVLAAAADAASAWGEEAACVYPTSGTVASDCTLLIQQIGSVRCAVVGQCLLWLCEAFWGPIQYPGVVGGWRWWVVGGGVGCIVWSVCAHGVARPPMETTAGGRLWHCPALQRRLHDVYMYADSLVSGRGLVGLCLGVRARLLNTLQAQQHRVVTCPFGWLVGQQQHAACHGL